MHEMTVEQWYEFFIACAEHLGPGDQNDSWCALTTFRRLAEDAGYWTHGLPLRDELSTTYIKDGGVWGQPFPFDELAHIVIPKTFSWEVVKNGEWNGGHKAQAIELLSDVLNKKQINHRLTELVLEIKCY